jgi:hypothetical protein
MSKLCKYAVPCDDGYECSASCDCSHQQVEYDYIDYSCSGPYFTRPVVNSVKCGLINKKNEYSQT